MITRRSESLDCRINQCRYGCLTTYGRIRFLGRMINLRIVRIIDGPEEGRLNLVSA